MKQCSIEHPNTPCESMVKLFNEIVYLPEFEKDLKKLSKRFRSLPEDLEAFVHHQLQLFHKLKVDNHGIFQIPSLPFTDPKIYKAKKFACKALKGRGAQSGIRVIYAYIEQTDRIEFIEIYCKADQVNEDKDRIIRLYKSTGSL